MVSDSERQEIVESVDLLVRNFMSFALVVMFQEQM